MEVKVKPDTEALPFSTHVPAKKDLNMTASFPVDMMTPGNPCSAEVPLVSGSNCAGTCVFHAGFCSVVLWNSLVVFPMFEILHSHRHRRQVLHHHHVNRPLQP